MGAIISHYVFSRAQKIFHQGTDRDSVGIRLSGGGKMGAIVFAGNPLRSLNDNKRKKVTGLRAF
jgi:hypothetical protein